MLAKTVIIASAAAFALGTFSVQRSEARGLGLGIGLGLIAASQAARAAREREYSYSRRAETKRSWSRSRAAQHVSRGQVDDDAAEERARAKARSKAKQQAEAKAELARMQSKLEKTKVVGKSEVPEMADKVASASPEKTVADPAPALESDRLIARTGEKSKKTERAPMTTAAADTDREPLIGRESSVGASPKLDCKRFVPAAGMTVTVPCGD